MFLFYGLKYNPSTMLCPFTLTCGFMFFLYKFTFSCLSYTSIVCALVKVVDMKSQESE